MAGRGHMIPQDSISWEFPFRRRPSTKASGNTELSELFFAKPENERSRMKRGILFWMTVMILWSVRADAQAPSLVGQWNWGAGGGITEIRADGTGRDARGNTMQWSVLNSAERSYTLRWSHGYTDTVTLSADGSSLSGTNQQGYRCSATRVGGASPAPPTVSAPSGGTGVAGEWNWGLGGGVVVINADGTGRDARGNTMKWTLRNPTARTYEFRWSHGYTDTATLSPDGNTLDAANDRGSRFTATRRDSGGGGGGGASARPLNLNGAWTNHLLHIWHEGDQVLITATWKRDNGVWVIWRAEGKLVGRKMDFPVRYSAMTNAVEGELRGIFTVSEDGNTITAHYTLNGRSYDDRVYHRDR